MTKKIKKFLFDNWAELGFLFLILVVCVDTMMSSFYMAVSDNIKYKVENSEPQEWNLYGSSYSKELFIVSQLGDEGHVDKILVTNALLGKQFWLDKSVVGESIKLYISDKVILVYKGLEVVQVIKVDIKLDETSKEINQDENKN